MPGSGVTRVVNKHVEAFDVDITRNGKWGNPFHRWLPASKLPPGGYTRDWAVDEHMEWIRTQPRLLDVLGELKGQRLGCVCKPKRCHGDNLVILVKERFGENA